MMSSPFVLLVDDDGPFVETMTKRLTKRNLRVLMAVSGQEALEKLNKNPNLEVVILDVKMPAMDGVETLMEIKKAYPLVEVIMLTAHAHVETAIEGMKAGAFDYLLKPCDLEHLMLKVEQATKKKRNHQEKIREAKVKADMSAHDVS